MTEKEWHDFLDKHIDLEHGMEIDSRATEDREPPGILFRDLTIPWYQKDDNVTRITVKKFLEMTPTELDEAVYGGLRVEHITRVTGYFTKVSQWNKGKLAELKDRQRQPI